MTIIPKEVVEAALALSLQTNSEITPERLAEIRDKAQNDKSLVDLGMTRAADRYREYAPETILELSSTVEYFNNKRDHINTVVSYILSLKREQDRYLDSKLMRGNEDYNIPSPGTPRQQTTPPHNQD